MYSEPVAYTRDGALNLCKTRIHPNAILAEADSPGEYAAIITNYLLTPQIHGMDAPLIAAASPGLPLRTFATIRLLILPTTRIQCNCVCSLVLVNNL